MRYKSQTGENQSECCVSRRFQCEYQYTDDIRVLFLFVLLKFMVGFLLLLINQIY